MISSVLRGIISTGMGVNQGIVVKIDYEEESTGKNRVDTELKDKLIAWSCC